MKKRKQQNKNEYIYILIIAILFVILVCSAYLKIEKKTYKVISRAKNVETYNEKSDKDTKAVGWLKIQGTNIDYPIVHSEKRKYPVEEKKYVWTNAHDEKIYDINTIYGHNIFNLSKTPEVKSKDFERFEELMSFVYYDIAKKNQFFQVTIDGKEYIYKIFNVSFINIYEEDIEIYNTTRTSFSDKEKKEFLNDLSKKNLYNYNTDVNEKDKIIILETCTRFLGKKNLGGRFLIVGRLLRNNEKADETKVTKTDKYKEVEEKLKGGK